MRLIKLAQDSPDEKPRCLPSAVHGSGRHNSRRVPPACSFPKNTTIRHFAHAEQRLRVCHRKLKMLGDLVRESRSLLRARLTTSAAPQRRWRALLCPRRPLLKLGQSCALLPPRQTRGYRYEHRRGSGSCSAWREQVGGDIPRICRLVRQSRAPRSARQSCLCPLHPRQAFLPPPHIYSPALRFYLRAVCSVPYAQRRNSLRAADHKHPVNSRNVRRGEHSVI